jgi:predicted ArsR family transcriptional regulator
MSDRRREILDTLRSRRSPMSIVAIASRIGVHPNTVRFHLRGLVDDGRVEQVENTRGTPGRPALMFRAQSGMDPTGPRNYRLLAGALADQLADGPDPGGKAMEAGRVWGSRLSQADADPSADPGVDGGAVLTEDQAIDRLVALLDDLGFAPEPDPGGAGSIGLRHCPFLDLVPEHAAVICPLHLGLMQGALDALGAQLTVTRLEPFVAPDLCLAHTGHVEPAS